jgi:hypothetical protein
MDELASLTMLQDLQMRCTYFSEVGEDLFIQLSRLTQLVLDENQLYGDDLDKMMHLVCQLPDLRALHLDGMHEGSVYGFEDLSRLTCPTRFSMNSFIMVRSPTYALAISSVKTLEHLNVMGSYMNGDDLVALQTLPRLRHLVIKLRQVGPNGAEALLSFPALRHLMLIYDPTGDYEECDWEHDLLTGVVDSLRLSGVTVVVME